MVIDPAFKNLPRFRERKYLGHALLPASGRFSAIMTGSCAMLRYHGGFAQDLGLGRQGNGCGL